MKRSGLKDFIKELEVAGELIRISRYVNPDLEIAEIVDRVSKSVHQNKAILFENTGTSFPLLINAYGSYKRICMALNVQELDDITNDLKVIFNQFSSAQEASWMEKLSLVPKVIELSSYMPKVQKTRGVCQEIIHKHPNLNILPILKCWPHDGGKFITLPVIHTKELSTKRRNVGMYRMQVFDQKSTGMHWHLHKVSAKHFHEYKAKGIRMPVAVSLGGDAVYTYCATAPLPENVDEYILAGFLRKKKVYMVNCITQPDIQVPEDSDIVIEGYIDTRADLVNEGPFGDHTGYYSLEDFYPQFHITAITHRKDAIYPATIVGVPPQEDTWLGKATERIFITPIQLTMMPELKDMIMPIEGVFHNLVFFSINKQFAGQAIKCMNTLWGAGQMMLNKMLIAFDDKIDIQQDITSFFKKTFEGFNPALHCTVSKGPLDVLDHSSDNKGYGGKLGIDLTSPIDEEIATGFHFPKISKINITAIKKMHVTIKNVCSKLNDQYGIPIILISVNHPKGLEIIKDKIANSKVMEGIKGVVFLDSNVVLDNISLVSWIALNHIDPNRDISISRRLSKIQKTKETATLFIDATSKHFNALFKRNWPNPVCSNKKTIKIVDRMWDSLGLGEYIPSPSLQIIPMSNLRGGAYAKKYSKQKSKKT